MHNVSSNTVDFLPNLIFSINVSCVIEAKTDVFGLKSKTSYRVFSSQKCLFCYLPHRFQIQLVFAGVQ